MNKMDFVIRKEVIYDITLEHTKKYSSDTIKTLFADKTKRAPLEQTSGASIL